MRAEMSCVNIQIIVSNISAFLSGPDGEFINEIN